MRWVVLIVLCGGACNADPRATSEEQQKPASAPTRAPALGSPQKGKDRNQRAKLEPMERLLAAHHLRRVRGDARGARRVLESMVADREILASIRARAGLALADLLELQGARREALSVLERARRLASVGSDLRSAAEKRRASILSATPLADVPGPTPGTVRLTQAGRAGVAFQGAERLLVAFYRVVLRPRIETIDRARAAKRRALGRAVVAYGRVIKLRNSEATLAARCRLGSMYQHMAEALAFDRPPELLPAAARRLSRELREESASYLRRALESYRVALKTKGVAAGAPWLKVARRQALPLAQVLEPGGKKKGPQTP
ncbi:MAG: hypothetical protein JRH20_14460 [Deltaproteobacteria bacterium]|nr:hypothetical protein [Deltaproteobacteria bacterium]